MLDTIGDFLDERFQQSDVLSVCGLRAMSLQNWNARGLGARPSRERPGTGNRRAYSALDILVLSVMKELTDLKIPVSFAHELAAKIVAPLIDRSGSLGDRLVVSVDRVCVLVPARSKTRFDLKWYSTDDSLSVIEATSEVSGAGCIVLPASRILVRVLEDLRRLVRPVAEQPAEDSYADANQAREASRPIGEEMDQTRRYESFWRAFEKSRSGSE